MRDKDVAVNNRTCEGLSSDKRLKDGLLQRRYEAIARAKENAGDPFARIAIAVGLVGFALSVPLYWIAYTDFGFMRDAGKSHPMALVFGVLFFAILGALAAHGFSQKSRLLYRIAAAIYAGVSIVLVLTILNGMR